MKAVLEAIAANKAGHDWQKDGGQYIPHPATWLNASGWEDEVEGGGMDDNAITRGLDELRRKGIIK